VDPDCRDGGDLLCPDGGEIRWLAVRKMRGTKGQMEMGMGLLMGIALALAFAILIFILLTTKFSNVEISPGATNGIFLLMFFKLRKQKIKYEGSG